MAVKIANEVKKRMSQKAAMSAPHGVTVVQEELDEILTLSKAALDALRTNVFIADRSFNLIYMNKKAQETIKRVEPEIKRIFNVSVDEMLNGSIHRFHRDPQAVEKILNDPDRLPHQAVFHFGEIWLETNINAIYDKNGDYIGNVVNWEDVSEERKKAEHAARLHSAIEGSTTAVMMIDRQRNITYVNPAASKMISKHRHVFKQVFPDLDLTNLVGGRIDATQTTPELQRALLTDPQDLPYTTTVKIGDVAFNLNVTALRDAGGDYSGATLEWVDVSDKVHVFETTKRVVADLNSSASDLLEINNQMASNAEETSAQSNNVSTASEEVSRNISGVATAIVEMNTTIKEVAERAAESAKVADNAVELSQEADSIITGLGESSKEISKVTKVINSIAEQTNLLALNATIEAARAGEAGKGFAVVANEVKELAKETGNATEDISDKIEQIQTNSAKSVEAIKSVSAIINRLNEIAVTIASAVEEQSATSDEISRNISEAATGADSIVENISQVSQAAENTADAASTTKVQSEKLIELSKRMQELVETIAT
ncbi:MAG: methyl-accepting chemotaxis protein [bacterium]